MGYNVVIAGGLGFIGRSVMKELIRKLMVDIEIIFVISRKSIDAQRCVLLNLLKENELELSNEESVIQNNNFLEILDQRFEFIQHDLVEADIKDNYSLINNDYSVFINLIGIKKPTKLQDFHQAHVVSVQNIINTCKNNNIKKIVHISVVCSAPNEKEVKGYQHTKWLAEKLLFDEFSDNGNDFTIVRPPIVFGNGDDTIRNIIRSLKHMPIFPSINGGESKHQPIFVEDLAKEVVELVSSNDSNEYKIYEVVGEKQLTVNEMIKCVSSGCSLSVFLIPVPYFMISPVVDVLTAVHPDPVITSCQLKMLKSGMVGGQQGDSVKFNGKTEKINTITVKSGNNFDSDIVNQMEGHINPLFNVSTRIIPSSTQVNTIKKSKHMLKDSLFLLLFTIIMFTIGKIMIDHVWYRSFIVNILSLPVFIYINTRQHNQAIPFKTLISPSFKKLIIGFLYGLVFWFLSKTSVIISDFLLKDTELLSLIQAEKLELYSWVYEVSTTRGVLMLIILCLGEELVYRYYLLYPLINKFNFNNPVLSEVLSFITIVIISFVWGLLNLYHGGLLLFLASIILGTLFSIVCLREHSIFAALISHLTWDYLTFYLLPL